jgi:hypothetical protein
MSTLLAMTSVVSMRGYMVGAGNDLFFGYLRILFAITTGFLWLRVLSFLKAINMQLATFVLAILQVRCDFLTFTTDRTKAHIFLSDYERRHLVFFHLILFCDLLRPDVLHPPCPK